MTPKKLTAAEARALLDVQPPIPVAHTSKTGRLLDDEGEQIPECQTVPWVLAFGPFGMWPTTVEDAEKHFAAHAEWVYGESLRIDHVVVYKRGWGYAAKAPEVTP